MRIRAARAADIEAMHAVRLGVAENRLSDPERITPACYRPYVEQGAAWVAETERGLAGFAILDVAAASVWALFVAAEAEGMGIGRALHARLLEAALEQGLERLSLTTAPGTRAERFYREAGWTRAGETLRGELSFEKNSVS
ncbi:MAG TPA: GNAT family N-acetyltransferase [Allosphingosinicella sp.]|jgi:GNAT superfamily N-acetyltransferase